MKKLSPAGLAIAAAAFVCAAQAGSFSIKPGQYETQVVPMDGGPSSSDTDCISEADAKDIVQYFKQEGSEESCKLTSSKLTGKHFSGESLCKGSDKTSGDVKVKTELTFSDTGYGGLATQTGTGTDGKPFTKKLKISAKRTGECKAAGDLM